MLQNKIHALPRLFIAQSFAADARLLLSVEQGHYVRTVMRLKQGNALRVFNSEDGEWLAQLQSGGKHETPIQLQHQLKPQMAEPICQLAFSPLKQPDRCHFLIEKATELGVSALLPVITKHTVKNTVKLEKWRRYAEEAAEQCERLTVPIIHEPVNLSELLEKWPANHHIIVCDESGGGKPLGEIVPGLPEGHYTLLTGPEGGFTQAELELLRKLPYVIAVGLGPRILRADTAALAALACFQSVRGDWRHAPRFIS